MSEPKRITVSVGRTIQTAPYESLRIDVTCEETLSPGQSFDKTFHSLYDHLEELVADKIEDAKG